uniref:Ig-like domain-containing protein n=1 Tax=Callorhinchus milii TaxID=7868 RepID=A0A4W3HW66_CALMI
MLQKGSVVELLIHNLTPGDTGEYTCDSGDQQTTACLAVTQPDIRIVEGLKDVEVFAGADALFECGVSHESAGDVRWSLGGIELQNNEMNMISVKSGNIHTLTLRKVTWDDSGVVIFTVGKDTSTAELKVKGKAATLNVNLSGVT